MKRIISIALLIGTSIGAYSQGSGDWGCSAVDPGTGTRYNWVCGSSTLGCGILVNVDGQVFGTCLTSDGSTRYDPAEPGRVGESSGTVAVGGSEGTIWYCSGHLDGDTSMTTYNWTCRESGCGGLWEDPGTQDVWGCCSSFKSVKVSGGS